MTRNDRPPTADECRFAWSASGRAHVCHQARGHEDSGVPHQCGYCAVTHEPLLLAGLPGSVPT